MKTDADRILILEDEDDLARMMRAVLEDEGYTVHVHPTGDCLDVIRAFRPHVVITDYMLPVYDGHVAIERIRRDIDPQMPCILMSAMPRAGMNWRVWGADDFLPKPFDLEVLLLAVERAAQQSDDQPTYISDRNYARNA